KKVLRSSSRGAPFPFSFVFSNDLRGYPCLQLRTSCRRLRRASLIRQLACLFSSLACSPDPAYCKAMAEAKKKDFENSARMLNEEDESTLAILRQRIKSSDENRLVSSEEVRQRMKKWLTKSSTT